MRAVRLGDSNPGWGPCAADRGPGAPSHLAHQPAVVGALRAPSPPSSSASRAPAANTGFDHPGRAARTRAPAHLADRRRTSRRCTTRTCPHPRTARTTAYRSQCTVRTAPGRTPHRAHRGPSSCLDSPAPSWTMALTPHAADPMTTRLDEAAERSSPDASGPGVVACARKASATRSAIGCSSSIRLAPVSSCCGCAASSLPPTASRRCCARVLRRSAISTPGVRAGAGGEVSTNPHSGGSPWCPITSTASDSRACCALPVRVGSRPGPDAVVWLLRTLLPGLAALHDYQGHRARPADRGSDRGRRRRAVLDRGLRVRVGARAATIDAFRVVGTVRSRHRAGPCRCGPEPARRRGAGRPSRDRHAVGSGSMSDARASAARRAARAGSSPPGERTRPQARRLARARARGGRTRLRDGARGGVRARRHADAAGRHVGPVAAAGRGPRCRRAPGVAGARLPTGGRGGPGRAHGRDDPHEPCRDRRDERGCTRRRGRQCRRGGRAGAAREVAAGPSLRCGRLWARRARGRRASGARMACRAHTCRDGRRAVTTCPPR